MQHFEVQRDFLVTNRTISRISLEGELFRLRMSIRTDLCNKLK